MINWKKREENEKKAAELVERLGLKNFEKGSVFFLMERIDDWNERVEKGELDEQKKTFSEERLVQADKWITERDERAAKFFEELKNNPKRLEPMFDYIRKLVGIPDLTFTIKTGEKYIEFTSNDISDNFIIRNAWAEFKIGDFNSGLSKELYEDGVDKYYRKKETDLSKPAEIHYWWSIHYKYGYLDGGTNAARIADAWVDDKFNWTFRNESERYKQCKAEREKMEQSWKELTKAV